MSLHIIKSTSAPAVAPTELNQHFLNTSNGDRYISSGTATVNDWGSPLGTGGLYPGVLNDLGNTSNRGFSGTIPMDHASHFHKAVVGSNGVIFNFTGAADTTLVHFQELLFTFSAAFSAPTIQFDGIAKTPSGTPPAANGVSILEVKTHNSSVTMQWLPVV